MSRRAESTLRGLGPFVREFLQAVAARFRGVEVPFRVDGQAVQPVPLPGIWTGSTPGVEHLQRLTVENPHLVVRTVRHDEELLLFVGRECDGERGAARVERVS